LAGLILNRVTTVGDDSLSAEQALVGAQRLDAAKSHPETAALLRLHAANIRSAERQRRIADRFHAAAPQVAQAVVPALADDVHDLAGLRLIGDLMAASSAR